MSLSSKHLAHLLAMSLLSISLLATTAACGGGNSNKGAGQSADLTNENDDVDSASEEESRDQPVPPEKLDEVARFFDRKNRFVLTCFTKAIDAGELPPRDKARIAITMTITESGKITNPKVTAMKPRSNVLRDCIFETMDRWTVTTLPKPLEFSHIFGFSPL